MCCSSAVNTTDLHLHALQSLAGATAVLYWHLLRICHHCCWLHLYPLLVFRLYHQPAFACRASLVPTAVLHSYELLVYCKHHRPAWVGITETCHYPRLPYIPTCYVSDAITTGYISTRSSSAVYIIDLRSYALQSFVATHCCPPFLHAAHLPSTSLICIHVLHNLISTCCCATFIHAARRSLTLSTCVRMYCTASLVPTAILHLHMRRVCHHCHWLHPYALLIFCLHRRPAFPCRASLLHTAVLHS